jgi:hypothetical protein
MYISKSYMEVKCVNNIAPRNLWEYSAIMFGVGYKNYMVELIDAPSVILLAYEDLLANMFQVYCYKHTHKYTFNYRCYRKYS